MFTLVTAEDDTQIFAWGIQITHGDGREAVIYRRDPDTGRPTFGVHASAESARALHTRVLRRALPTGLRLVWMDGDHGLAALLDPDPAPALT